MTVRTTGVPLRTISRRAALPGTKRIKTIAVDHVAATEPGETKDQTRVKDCMSIGSKTITIKIPELSGHLVSQSSFMKGQVFAFKY